MLLKVIKRKGIRFALGAIINYTSMMLSSKTRAGDGLLCAVLNFINNRELQSIQRYCTWMYGHSYIRIN